MTNQKNKLLRINEISQNSSHSAGNNHKDFATRNFTNFDQQIAEFKERYNIPASETITLSKIHSSSPDTNSHSEEQSSSEPLSKLDPEIIASLNASRRERQKKQTERNAHLENQSSGDHYPTSPMALFDAAKAFIWKTQSESIRAYPKEFLDYAVEYIQKHQNECFKVFENSAVSVGTYVKTFLPYFKSSCRLDKEKYVIIGAIGGASSSDEESSNKNNLEESSSTRKGKTDKGKKRKFDEREKDQSEKKQFLSADFYSEQQRVAETLERRLGASSGPSYIHTGEDRVDLRDIDPSVIEAALKEKKDRSSSNALNMDEIWELPFTSEDLRAIRETISLEHEKEREIFQILADKKDKLDETEKFDPLEEVDPLADYLDFQIGVSAQIEEGNPVLEQAFSILDDNLSLQRALDVYNSKAEVYDSESESTGQEDQLLGDDHYSSDAFSDSELRDNLKLSSTSDVDGSENEPASSMETDTNFSSSKPKTYAQQWQEQIDRNFIEQTRIKAIRKMKKMKIRQKMQK